MEERVDKFRAFINSTMPDGLEPDKGTDLWNWLHCPADEFVAVLRSNIPPFAFEPGYREQLVKEMISRAQTIDLDLWDYLTELEEKQMDELLDQLALLIL